VIELKLENLQVWQTRMAHDILDKSLK